MLYHYHHSLAHCHFHWEIIRLLLGGGRGKVVISNLCQTNKLGLNPFTPEGFPVDKENYLALDRLKSISVSWHLRELKG